MQMTLEELDMHVQNLKRIMPGDARVLIPGRITAAEHLTQVDRVTVSIKGKDVPGVLLG
jgi:hypothetical protein